MQIEPTQGSDPLGLPDGSRQPQPPGPAAHGAGPKPDETDRPDAADLQAYLAQASTGDEEAIRAEAVAEAKRLLASGALDTPEAAERAAEAILTIGI